jgi:hypothetical protein
MDASMVVVVVVAIGEWKKNGRPAAPIGMDEV